MEGVKIGKARILDLLVRKNQKIDWFEKLPPDHQFYKHYINIQAVNAIEKTITSKVKNNREVFNNAAESLTREEKLVEVM